MKSRERILDETIERQARVIERLKLQEGIYKELLITIRNAINIHLGGDGTEGKEDDDAKL